MTTGTIKEQGSKRRQRLASENTLMHQAFYHTSDPPHHLFFPHPIFREARGRDPERVSTWENLGARWGESRRTEWLIQAQVRFCPKVIFVVRDQGGVVPIYISGSLSREIDGNEFAWTWLERFLSELGKDFPGFNVVLSGMVLLHFMGLLWLSWL